MSTNEDDNTVIKEIPVYLCKDLGEKLYLFQFPCRPDEKLISGRNIVSSRVKPQHGLVQLDYGLCADNEYYDKYAGEEFSSNSNTVKPTNKEKKCVTPVSGKLMDKITYQSERSILKKDLKGYSVASFYNGKFCITPLHDTATFLPTYEHVERSKRLKATCKNLISNDSSSEDESEEHSAAAAVQVTVKFSQKNAAAAAAAATTDKSKNSHQLNHQQYSTKIAEEPWFEATYLNHNSSTAITMLEGLTNTISRNRNAMFSLTEGQYLDVIVPADSSDQVETHTTT